MKFIFGALCCTALAALATMPSYASTVTLDVLGMPNSERTSAQLDGVEVEPLGNNEFASGSFLMQDVDTLEELIAWCIQIEVLIDLDPSVYNTGSALLDPERESLLSRLFTGFYDETTTDIGAAAFQLAIWEIVEETTTDVPSLSVSDGRFTAASASASVVDTANGFLAGLNGFDAEYQIEYFQSADSQDLISATPIPLPASILFLGLGMGALALVKRRERATDAARLG